MLAKRRLSSPLDLWIVPALAVAAVIVLLAGAGSVAATEPVAPTGSAAPEREVWLTLGADAFETALRAADLEVSAPRPRRLAERDGVVLTRLAEKDLAQLSELLHDTHRRCPGFVVHGSREAGERALAGPPESLAGTPVYTIDQPTLVQNLQAAIDPAQILGTITHLSTTYNNRYYRHPSGTAASEWIRDLWQGYAVGRPDVTAELYPHTDWAQPSVVLTIPGTTNPEEVIVLGGHLDSVSFGSWNPDFSAPGADDNASGIATLSEVIRVAMEQGFRPQRTVRFMGYAAEEAGLLGSQDIAGAYQTAGTDVVAVLQLDMTAYNGSTEDIALLSDFTDSTLTAFIGNLLDTYQPDIAWTTTACGYGCSDHASWHAEGYPAAMPSESRFGEHNPTIHTTSDTTATFGNTASHSAKFARLAAAFMAEIGVDGGNEEVFSDGFESGAIDGWSVSEP